MKRADFEPTSVRLSKEDKTQLDQLMAKLAGFGVHSIRRAAVRLGATLLETDQEALTVASMPAAQRRAWLKAKLR